MSGNFDDELRETMRAHDRLAPSMQTFRFHAPAPGPVIHIRRTVLAASIAAVGLVVSTAIVVLVRSDRQTHAGAPTPTASSQASQPTDDRVSCPARADPATTDYLKVGPSVGIDTKASLVPASAPAQVVICAYQVADKGKLTGRRTLDSGLAEFASQLHWLPPRPRNTSCALYLTATDGEYYLIHASYPNGSLWIAAPGQHCLGASNGTFESTNLSEQAGTAYATARWPADPVTADACHAGRGRLGQQDHLVPDSPTGITVCDRGRTTAGTSAAAIQLASALNRLHTTSTQPAFSCNNGVPMSESMLTFTYPDGPPLQITILHGCTPDLTNGNLDAQQSNTITTKINNIQARG